VAVVYIRDLITSTMFPKAWAIDALSKRFDYILYVDGDVLERTETAAIGPPHARMGNGDDPSLHETTQISADPATDMRLARACTAAIH
jgi:hypothetical protein